MLQSIRLGSGMLAKRLRGRRREHSMRMTLNGANRAGCFVALVVTLVLVLEAVLNLHGQATSGQPRSAREEVIDLAARGEYAAADRILAEELRNDPANFALLYNRALVNFFWK